MTDDIPIREPDQIDGVLLPEQQHEVYGHEAARATIMSRLQGGTLPNAVLMHGPQGIGKATLAFKLARDIFVATGDEDAHRVDEQVMAGSHPNLFVLRRQPKDGRGFYTVIRVDDIRQLVEDLRKTRGRAGHRVAIIDSIDDCNASSANALLKILEEPPAETIFLLVSHRPGSLLPTIKSRCHSLAMRPLADADVRAVLERSPGAEHSQLEAAVGLAHGRPRKGFEAMLVSGDGTLAALRGWLAGPERFPSGAHLALADAIAAGSDTAEAAFARELIVEWLANEAKSAALQGPAGRIRLASATELWDKAQALFDETDTLNLDMRQTLTVIFDAIKRHLSETLPLSEPS
ncbi:AAA family ATPase [Paradevosia shaoguanensis]|uniref:AAA family ATPase n=1 Tax=Paradevosia shaoguanensis TaxID=1335043 RepID=UPI0019342753|nr:AAA family ATPase [Paradevosia shaoguanensis]